MELSAGYYEVPESVDQKWNTDERDREDAHLVKFSVSFNDIEFAYFISRHCLQGTDLYCDCPCKNFDCSTQKKSRKCNVYLRCCI